MKRQEWLLLAISESTEGLTPVQIQKTLFLLGKERGSLVGSGFYKFKPFNYGPFDVQVYRDADELAAQGLVVILNGGTEAVRRYQVTPAGHRAAAELAQGASPDAVEYLKRVVSWVERQSFRGLVEAIYRRYPEQRANSVFAS